MKVYLVLKSNPMWGSGVVSVHADKDFAMQNCAWLNQDQDEAYVIQELELEA